MYGFNVGPKLYGSVGRRSVFHVINIYRVLAQLSAAQTSETPRVRPQFRRFRLQPPLLRLWHAC